MLLQTVLTGKAQRAYATLPTENCTDYEMVKAVVLKSFELVPEVYKLPMRGISLILGNEVKSKKCQSNKMAKMRFRTQRKKENQSYVEFLHEKENVL